MARALVQQTEAEAQTVRVHDPSQRSPDDVSSSAPGRRQAWTTAPTSQPRPAARDDDPFFVAADTGRGRSGLAQVVLSLSGSGGVGKTTMAMALAQRAATRGKRVILVDANIGQGDVAAYLRLHTSTLPTMYEALGTGPRDLRRSLLAPKALQEARDPRLAAPHFALLRAPSLAELRSGRIDAAGIFDLIEDARSLADLVVVDTQIVEPDDPRWMLQSMIMPAIGRGAWALTVTSLSAASVRNAKWLMEYLQEEGINPSHIMSILARVPSRVELNTAALAGLLSSLSVHLGTAWESDDVLMSMNRGEPIGDLPPLAWLLDAVLEILYDLDPTAPVYDPHAVAPKRSWIRRKR